MKQHPFFQGVNFEKVSKKKYKDLPKLIAEHHPGLSEKKIDGLENQDEGATVEGTRCTWKGNLCKKNWYGNK